MTGLYGRDFVGWTERQVRLLRVAGRGRANAALDWEHLAEEIENFGCSELPELGSPIRRTVHHRLKPGSFPAMEPRRGWRDTVGDARADVESRGDPPE